MFVWLLHLYFAYVKFGGQGSWLILGLWLGCILQGFCAKVIFVSSSEDSSSSNRYCSTDRVLTLPSSEL